MQRYRWISLFIIISIIHGGSYDSVLGYFTESTSKILLNQSNQLILGSAALAALAATQVDQQVKSYAQTKGLLPDNISHFGDMYGGNWGHWILLSSILVTSLNDDGEPKNSAGTPILGVLKSNNLTNALIVVVRYFGGTKLGVGGLIEAYRKAGHEAIVNGQITSVKPQLKKVSFNNLINRINFFFLL